MIVASHIASLLVEFIHECSNLGLILELQNIFKMRYKFFFTKRRTLYYSMQFIPLNVNRNTPLSKIIVIIDLNLNPTSQSYKLLNCFERLQSICKHTLRWGCLSKFIITLIEQLVGIPELLRERNLNGYLRLCIAMNFLFSKIVLEKSEITNVCKVKLHRCSSSIRIGNKKIYLDEENHVRVRVVSVALMTGDVVPGLAPDIRTLSGHHGDDRVVIAFTVHLELIKTYVRLNHNFVHIYPHFSNMLFQLLYCA